ncbi:MAG: hypothetical protein AAFQ52_04180 [Chloroflexota bacterium]
MNLDFLTPENFDMLVLANLAVAVLLIAWRFYQDMSYQPEQEESASESYDFDN